LRDIGVSGLPNVQSGIVDRDKLRSACIGAGVGISSASYAIADPGALVILAGEQEERLISLAPPRHIAVVPAGRVLTSLDELFTVVPDPALESSSMVLIGGPSRTGDIEMTLTLGVHGPREVYVVIV
jgi:L-lactate dehydrogenase complex protein LldG